MAGNLEENPVTSNLCTVIYGNFLLRNYHGFWYPERFLSGAIAIQQHFNPRPTDILISSTMKSGTTWLKALSFATINRKRDHPSDPDHPLLFNHPRDCVPFLEEIFTSGRTSELGDLGAPKLLSTHLPCQHLPKSVIESDCKIVYICRDPKDTVVSNWHFFRTIASSGGNETELFPFDEAFEMCCKGIVPYGPMWDHWLGYWEESLRRPSKVLFLKYEDLTEDAVGNLKRLAEFVGCPFSPEEEMDGVVEEIVRLCSFEKLSGLEVNKRGNWTVNGVTINYSSYFRKGKIGDWKNHLTSEMAQRLDQITEEKLWGSGLSFRSVSPRRSSGGQ